jgi:hypothetical protein
MSVWADKLRVRTDPVLRTVLQRWIDIEQEPQTRLEALGVAADVRQLVDEILDQRVLEARSFRHTWAEIAAAIGVTRQSAHRRWRDLDPLADAVAADRQHRFHPSRPPPVPPPPVVQPADPQDWDDWRPGHRGE